MHTVEPSESSACGLVLLISTPPVSAGELAPWLLLVLADNPITAATITAVQSGAVASNRHPSCCCLNRRRWLWGERTLHEHDSLNNLETLGIRTRGAAWLPSVATSDLSALRCRVNVSV